MDDIHKLPDKVEIRDTFLYNEEVCLLRRALLQKLPKDASTTLLTIQILSEEGSNRCKKTTSDASSIALPQLDITE